MTRKRENEEEEEKAELAEKPQKRRNDSSNDVETHGFWSKLSECMERRRKIVLNTTADYGILRETE